MQSETGNTTIHSDPFFTSTLRYIRFQKQKGGLMGEKYDPIKLWLISATVLIKSREEVSVFSKEMVKTLKRICVHMFVFFLVHDKMEKPL